MSPFRTAAPRPPEPRVPFDWTRVSSPLKTGIMPFVRILKIVLFPLFFILYYTCHGLWYPLNFAVGYVFFGNSCHFLRRTGRSRREGYGSSVGDYMWSETVNVKTDYGGTQTMVFQLSPAFPNISWWDLFEPKKE